MKKLLQSLFVIAGLAVTMGIANAQTGSTVVSVFSGATVEGTYLVNITETAPLSNIFDVSVSQLTGNPHLLVPAHLDQITFQFFTGTAGLTTQVGVNSLTGGTNAGGTNWTPTSSTDFGTEAEYQTVTPADWVKAGQGFKGVVDLAATPSIISGAQVQADLQNSGTGNGIITLTPESASWLLLLVAALPLGLLALRRRSAASRTV